MLCQEAAQRPPGNDAISLFRNIIVHGYSLIEIYNTTTKKMALILNRVPLQGNAFLGASSSPETTPSMTPLVLFHFYILPCARSVARRAPRRTPLPPPFGAPICPLGPAGSNRVSIAPGTRLPSPVLGFRRFATAQTHLQPHPTAVAVPGGRDAPLLAAQQRRDIVISRYLDFEIFRF